MKKLFVMLLCISFILSPLSQAVYAGDPGEGNLDGGGGGLGEGTADSFWNPGNDGVRVSIVDSGTGEVLCAPMDFSNRVQPGTLLYFGAVSKVQYRAGADLSLQSGTAYQCLQPMSAMPAIIGSGGHSNIEAVKGYFCSEYASMMIAEAAGFDYGRLISGDYKLLLEPIGYFTFEGRQYGMTATEAALYDQLSSGALRSKMGALTHQNLPLSMFLEYGDLEFAAWSSPASGRQSNADIINFLGLGVIRFSELDEIEGSIDAVDVEYRTDTDVITSVTLHASSNLTPDRPASVTFDIDGRTYTINNIVIPSGNSQVVWVKWHTPSVPQDITIQVSVRGAYTAQDTFLARIVDLSEKIPPDPLATDTNPGYSVPGIPSFPQKTTAHWGVWRCYWVPVWVWHSYSEGGGYHCDHGHWEYAYDAYSANLRGSMSLMPDDAVPTAEGKKMKSGYGVKTDVSAVLSTDAPIGHYTYTQTALATFPEFNYETYLRLLQRVSGGLNAKFRFKENAFSTYNRNVHFTPVYFPDDTDYVASVQVWDTWTPDGMLSLNLSDYVSIRSSIFDDWYTNRD